MVRYGRPSNHSIRPGRGRRKHFCCENKSVPFSSQHDGAADRVVQGRIGAERAGVAVTKILRGGAVGATQRPSFVSWPLAGRLIRVFAFDPAV